MRITVIVRRITIVRTPDEVMFSASLGAQAGRRPAIHNDGLPGNKG